MPCALTSPTLSPQSSSAPRRDSTSITRMLMGKCVLLGKEWNSGEGPTVPSLRLGP